jgi:hypothetical protein
MSLRCLVCALAALQTGADAPAAAASVVPPTGSQKPALTAAAASSAAAPTAVAKPALSAEAKPAVNRTATGGSKAPKAPKTKSSNGTATGGTGRPKEAAAKAAAKAATKAELMAFVGNVTGVRSGSAKADHSSRSPSGSRGLGKLIAVCALTFAAPVAIAVLLVLRARRKVRRIVIDDYCPPPNTIAARLHVRPFDPIPRAPLHRGVERWSRRMIRSTCRTAQGCSR